MKFLIRAYKILFLLFINKKCYKIVYSTLLYLQMQRNTPVSQPITFYCLQRIYNTVEIQLKTNEYTKKK